jgi:hypothetical protein
VPERAVSWTELAGWFRDLTDDGLRQELEMLTREYEQAGRASKPVIGEQLDVLKAEIARRGEGGPAGPPVV